jgi:hypothetical protein
MLSMQTLWQPIYRRLYLSRLPSRHQPADFFCQRRVEHPQYGTGTAYFYHSLIQLFGKIFENNL